MAHHERPLDPAQVAGQALHCNVTANIAKARAETKAESKVMLDDAHNLAQSIKTTAASQTEAVNRHLHTAVAKLEAAAARIKASAVTGDDHIKQANAALLAGAHAAAHSVRHPVAILRGKAAAQKPETPEGIR